MQCFRFPTQFYDLGFNSKKYLGLIALLNCHLGCSTPSHVLGQCPYFNLGLHQNVIVGFVLWAYYTSPTNAMNPARRLLRPIFQPPLAFAEGLRPPLPPSTHSSSSPPPCTLVSLGSRLPPIRFHCCSRLSPRTPSERCDVKLDPQGILAKYVGPGFILPPMISTRIYFMAPLSLAVHLAISPHFLPGSASPYFLRALCRSGPRSSKYDT